MKKSTVVIIVIILVILGIAFYFYNVDVSKKQLEEKLKTSEENWNLNSKNSELEDKLEKQENNKEDIQTEKNVKFDSSKMKSDSTNVRYEETKDWSPNSAGLEIEIKDGKPYLTTDIENEQYKFLFSEVTKPVKNKELTGFNLDVKEVYYAYMGNGDMSPYILFIMEDGSVEYINSNKMLKLGKYESFGNVKEISNIVKFVHLDAQEVDENGEGMSGWITCVAIDKDGYSYDLSQSETLQKDMLLSN